MKTKIKNTLWLSIFTGTLLIGISNDTKAQDDIYYVPAKKSNSPSISPGQNLSADSSGITDYERYRSYRDGYANKKDVKSDSSISHDDISKKKGMERYGDRNVENDSASYVNNNQSYSGQPSDLPEDGTTIINNYNNDDGYYNDRFRGYHRFYCDYGYDPFWSDYYDPYYFGYSSGYPYYGFSLGLYSPFWGYEPYYYRPYSYGYYGGHGNGYYNHNEYHNNGYVHSGGARRTFGTLSSPSTRRSGNIANQPMLGTASSGRRSVNSRPVTPSDNYGATYDGARRRGAWQTYQTTSASNVATTRRGSGNNPVSSNRNLSIPTTRLENNTRGYSPSYSVPGNSTRRSYNSSGNNNNSSETFRRSNSSGSSENNRTYSQPSYSNHGNSSSQPRRSSESYSAPARSFSSPSSSPQSSSGSSGNGGGGSRSSSGSSSSGSSGHSSSGGGGHRR
jgi:hypothetical protein